MPNGSSRLPTNEQKEHITRKGVWPLKRFGALMARSLPGLCQCKSFDMEEIMKPMVSTDWRVLAVPVASLAALLLATPQVALADSGTFEEVSSFTTHYITFEHGDETIIGGTLDGTRIIISSSGEPFVKGESSITECLVFVRKTANGIDNESPCTFTDSSQDKLFTVARRRAGNMEAGGQGKIEIQGGTGKYKGITGSCGYRVTYLPGNRATSVHTCDWQKP